MPDRQFFHAGSFWGAHTGPNPTDRGKAGVKHHVATDGQGTPLVAQVTAANVHDSRQLLPLITAIPRVRGRVGAPKQRPGSVCADKAYDSQRLRNELLRRGMVPEIPHRNSGDDGLGHFRWPVERTVAWYRQFRRLKICYEKLPEMHQGFLDLATCLITFRRFPEAFC